MIQLYSFGSRNLVGPTLFAEETVLTPLNELETLVKSVRCQ